MGQNTQGFNKKELELCLEWGNIQALEMFTMDNGESTLKMVTEPFKIKKQVIAIPVVGKRTKKMVLVNK